MLRLVQTAPCEFDLAADHGDDDLAAVETLVYALLFTDQQAPARRVPTQWDRRGWYKSPQAGSALWHVRRQPLTDDARREVVSIITRTLSRAPALQDIAVTDERTSAPSGNVSSVFFGISGMHNGRKFMLRIALTP